MDDQEGDNASQSDWNGGELNCWVSLEIKVWSGFEIMKKKSGNLL